jgi:hypothetical protein
MTAADVDELFEPLYPSEILAHADLGTLHGRGTQGYEFVADTTVHCGPPTEIPEPSTVDGAEFRAVLLDTLSGMADGPPLDAALALLDPDRPPPDGEAVDDLVALATATVHSGGTGDPEAAFLLAVALLLRARRDGTDGDRQRLLTTVPSRTARAARPNRRRR